MSLDLLPVLYEATSKKLALSEDTSLEEFPELFKELEQLNTLTGEIIQGSNDVPAPPSKENFSRTLSAMIKKLYDSGITSFKNGKYVDAVKQFSVGIEMISRRAKFESFQLTISELGLFLMSRCDSYLKAKNYLGAFNDADLLLGLMVNTPDNFLRRGVSNYFLGNYEAAKADYERGLAFDENNNRLKTELDVVSKKLREENGEL